MKSMTITKLGGPQTLRLVERPDPLPASDEVTIKVAYIGVGGIDTIMRRGDLGAMNPQPPFVPGLEVSGTIIAVGTDVHDFEIGDRVAALLLLQMGGYATIVCCKATNVIPVPAAVELSSACMLVNPTTALTVLCRTEPHDADTIVVHGASGGLGACFGPIARAVYPNIRILATVRNEAKRQAAMDAGFSDSMLTEEFITSVSEGTTYDAIIDPVGGDLRRTSLNGLRPFGKLLIVGNVSGDTESLITSQQVWLNSLAVFGFNLGLFNTMHPEKVTQAARDVLNLVAQGKLTLAPHKIFAFTDVVEAHKYVEMGNMTGQLILAV